MYFRNFNRSFAGAVVLSSLVMFGTQSIAQDQASSEGAAADAPPSPAMTRARDVALARISQDLSHEQIGVLNLIAHATAAAGLCVDIGLDEGAVYGALADVTHEATDDESEEEAARHRDFSLIAFGVLSGIMLQQGAEDEAGFCASAVQLAQDPDMEKFIRIVSSAVPYSPEAPQQ